jgi:hypothetical protein
MRRKAVHLAAAIAELLRFLALAFLAYSIGALFNLNSSVSALLRYAAASQLLFAAGFFFLWLDPARYSAFRPLLGIGKAACIVCMVPLALALAGDPNARSANFGLRAAGLGLASFVAAVDIATAAVLAAVAVPKAAPGGSAAAPGSGQGPGDIERVEGL